MRAGALGCLLGRRAPCVQRAGGARPPSLPQCLPGPPSWRPHLSVCPGLGSGWTGSRGYQVRVGTPGGSPSSRVHIASGLHTLAPPSCPFVPRRKPGPGGHRGGGGGVSPAACAHNTLRQARLCTRHAWVRWAARAGRAAEEGTFLPVCRRAQAGADSSWPLPPSVERSWQGWRTQAGIAGASTWPRARPVCEPKLWPLTLVRSREPVRFPGPAPQTSQRLRKTLGAALALGRRLPRWAGHAAGGARGPS